MQQTGNENKPRKCGWLSCSHVATSVRNLKSHVEREHLNHLSQFVCRWDTCGRTASFKALYMLSLHLRSHIGDRPYECRVSVDKFQLICSIFRFVVKPIPVKRICAPILECTIRIDRSNVQYAKKALPVHRTKQSIKKELTAIWFVAIFKHLIRFFPETFQMPNG